MADKTHHYTVRTRWTGDTGQGTTSYRGFDRAHDVEADGRPQLLGSADEAFRGDPARWNPELFLLAALSECHMLSYLALAPVAGVNVLGYTDAASGSMVTHADASGEFVEVTLRPQVTVASETMLATAEELHKKANEKCFIARSVNFPVHHDPTITVAGQERA